MVQPLCREPGPADQKKNTGGFDLPIASGLLLVSLDISNAMNSGDVLVVPATHLLIRPRPLEGMGVEPVVFRPRGHHMVDVLPTTGPRTPLQVATAEGVV